uniref:CENP-T/Histone H4 histone fold domain-containing protein n=1 Tax=Astyanax mexicanus TaxID=7994 RepID=A0A3B1JTR6_ASTMX
MHVARSTLLFPPELSVTTIELLCSKTRSSLHSPTPVYSNFFFIIYLNLLQKYFERLAEDLEVFSAHARRRTIEVEDVELLMRRMNFLIKYIYFSLFSVT